MKYNGFYFWMFKGSMKKVIAEKYGDQYAAEIIKKSKAVYRKLVAEADDIGDDNPMAYTSCLRLRSLLPILQAKRRYPLRQCRK